MKKGDRVNIFQKPVTHEDSEGQATIIRLYPKMYNPTTKLHSGLVQFAPGEPTVLRQFFAADIHLEGKK